VTDAIRDLAAALAPSRAFVLDGKALAMGHASRFLAIDPSALGATMALDSRPAAERTSTSDDVAIIDIRGPLAQRAEAFACEASVDGYDAIEKRFGVALADPDVSAIMLRVDSPGGDCAGCFEAVGRMQRARDRWAKHVAVYVDEKACSAAYALSMVASPGAISLPQSAITGSIGVLSAHEDASEALAAAGRRWTIIRSGARKAETSGLEPLTDAARVGVQEMVDTLASQFFDIVSKARGISMADLRASEILDGHVVLGREAVRLGLADKVEGWESALARAGKEGRRARKEKQMKAINTALGLPETASEEQALTAIGALKLDAATGKAALAAQEAHAKQLAADLAESERKAQVTQAIESAITARKIPPSAHARTDGAAFAAKYGLEALEAHYAAMPAQPALAGPVGRDVKTDTGIPEGSAAWETMTPMALHRFRVQHGDDAYAAIKADWIRRGSPAAIPPIRQAHALAERN
jgi:ClpP class serine protease